MNAAQAEEKLKQLHEVKDNYMIFKIGYSDNIIVPFVDAEKIISGLHRAETYTANYGKEPVITGIDKEFTFNFMSYKEYAEIKMKTLLMGETEDDETQL